MDFGSLGFQIIGLFCLSCRMYEHRVLCNAPSCLCGVCGDRDDVSFLHYQNWSFQCLSLSLISLVKCLSTLLVFPKEVFTVTDTFHHGLSGLDSRDFSPTCYLLPSACSQLHGSSFPKFLRQMLRLLISNCPLFQI